MLPLITLGACGSDAELPAPTVQPPAVQPGNPLAEIPPEELYGASPEDNLWSPRIELEVMGLPAGWNGARIAILSDFHLGVWDGNQDVALAAMQRAVEANPELIVLLGDFISEGNDVTSLEQVLAPIRGRPAFAVLGERDIRSDSLAARITSALSRAGVQVLSNTANPVVMNGDTAWIAGADPELLSMSAADQQYILATLGVPGRTPLLLAHSPALAARAPDYRYPVVLGGDTFCGELEVPGSRRLATLRNDIFPGGLVEGVDRLFRVEGSTILITCGVGYGYLPLRFGSPPEVPILTLVGDQPPAPADTTDSTVPDSLLEQFQSQSADTL